MLSKEEIEKAKERVNNLGKSIQAICKEKSNIATSIETLLQYIDQLEQENNKQNKIIDEMAKVICMLDTFDNYDTWNNDISEVKQYFEKKVNESNG